MFLKKLASVATFAVALLGTASIASASAEQWLNSYYQNPQPRDVVKSTFALSEEGYFAQDSNIATAIGFYSQVFAENPAQIDRWFAQFRDLPSSEQRLLASALWYSGNAKGEAMLRRLARDAAPETRKGIERMLATAQASVAATPVLSTSSMNLQWGAFLSSGDEKHVTNILAAVGRGDIGQTARTSLAFNAAQHERVLDICRAQLTKQPNEVRSVLRAVINDAETSKKQLPTT